MRKVISIISVVVLFVSPNLNSENRPPIPATKGAGGFEDIYVVGGAIDNYVILMMIVGMFLGLFGIKRYIERNKLIN